MAKSPEVPVVFDLPDLWVAGNRCWWSLLISWPQELSCFTQTAWMVSWLPQETEVPTCGAWSCPVCPGQGVRGTTICCVRFLGNRLLIGWSNSSIRNPYGSIKFWWQILTALATTCGEGFLFPTWTCFFTRPSFDPRRHYKLNNKHLPLNPVTVPSYSHVCWLSVVRHHHNQLRHRSKLSWITYLGWPRSVRRVVSQKDAGATRVSGATVMVEAVILQENAWEVLDENTSTQFLMIFLLNSTM